MKNIYISVKYNIYERLHSSHYTVHVRFYNIVLYSCQRLHTRKTNIDNNIIKINGCQTIVGLFLKNCILILILKLFVSIGTKVAGLKIDFSFTNIRQYSKPLCINWIYVYLVKIYARTYAHIHTVKLKYLLCLCVEVKKLVIFSFFN